MNSNIEIKAKAGDFERQKQLARQFSNSQGELIEQEDTFFRVSKGRLKLRAFSANEGELIYYERDNQEGPKLSKYSITKIDEPAGLKSALAAALGVLGVVRKKRYLYLVGQTRIHLDEVEGLGNFIELEVVMLPNQGFQEGSQIARDLMDKLEIQDGDLIDRAYIDLLLEGV